MTRTMMVALPAIPFSCFNARNLVCVAAWHTITTLCFPSNPTKPPENYSNRTMLQSKKTQQTNKQIGRTEGIQSLLELMKWYLRIRSREKGFQTVRRDVFSFLGWVWSHGSREREEREMKLWLIEAKLQDNSAVQVQGNDFTIDINRQAQPLHSVL